MKNLKSKKMKPNQVKKFIETETVRHMQANTRERQERR